MSTKENSYQDKLNNKVNDKVNDEVNNDTNNNLLKEYKDLLNRVSPDSIIFLSEMNNKLLTELKVKSFFSTKKLSIYKLNKLKKYLIDTENLVIIENKDIKNYLDKKEIYFDDENHINSPKCDILYRKVNDNYYINNDNYFEKCTSYYYELYSNVFAIFDLKKITLEYYNINNINNKNSFNINSGFAEAGIKYENTDDKKKNILKTMIFNKNYKNNIYNEFNSKKKDEQIKYLLNELPSNFTKSIYNLNNIIPLINNRTKNILSKTEKVQTIENTNIKKLEITIKNKFNLISELGIFGNYEKTNYRNERVIFQMEFYDIEENNFTENINNKTEQETNKNTPKKNIEWLSLERGDLIPSNAIYGGITKSDGEVYVGKINNSPGKVNLKNNKIWNYWVQNFGSSKKGRVLISDFPYEWISIKRGDNIPLNAVFCGLDESNDKVWIGKSNNNEPGKITCIDNKDTKPRMKNIWCHSSWHGNSSGYVLIIKTNTIINNKKIEEFNSFE